jgi:hypothetical protein
VPHLCGFYSGICLTTEEKARKNLSQGRRRVPAGTIKIQFAAFLNNVIWAAVIWDLSCSFSVKFSMPYNRLDIVNWLNIPYELKISKKKTLKYKVITYLHLLISSNGIAFNYFHNRHLRCVSYCHFCWIYDKLFNIYIMIWTAYLNAAAIAFTEAS